MLFISKIGGYYIMQITAKNVLEKLDDMFPIVHGSQLSMDDKFMTHSPIGWEQERLKNSLIQRIKKGIGNFRIPRIDPSFDEEGKLVFEEGKLPGVGQVALWWKNAFSNFCPEKNSRMATDYDYDVFCGVFIKNLVESGYDVAQAWYEVCDDSCRLGHFWDSPEAKEDFELTGSRTCGVRSDLGNTQKVITDEEGITFLVASGCYSNSARLYAISRIEPLIYTDYTARYSTGLMVMDV